jgi:hypothetical protein
VTLVHYVFRILNNCIRIIRMTPRTSVRALARKIYTKISADEARKEEVSAHTEAGTPTPNPSPQGGGEQAVPNGDAARRAEKKPYVAPPAVGPDLMAQVRALYEDSDVPVREIARRAGVTERTLYNYVERYAWRRRYKLVARDEAVAAANRGRSLQPRDGFAAAKGAGGRFIRREDAGKPHASGLKALDPAARAEAEADCAEAARVAARAREEAEEERRFESGIRAGELMHRLTRELFRDVDQRGTRKPTPLECRLEAGRYDLLLTVCEEWKSLLLPYLENRLRQAEARA